MVATCAIHSLAKSYLMVLTLAEICALAFMTFLRYPRKPNPVRGDRRGLVKFLGVYHGNAVELVEEPL